MSTTVYLVLDDFGKLGRAYLETDEEKADFGTITEGLLSGQYKKPLRVVAPQRAGSRCLHRSRHGKS